MVFGIQYLCMCCRGFGTTYSQMMKRFEEFATQTSRCSVRAMKLVLCISRNGVHLNGKRKFADHSVNITTTFDPPLFPLGSTFKYHICLFGPQMALANRLDGISQGQVSISRVQPLPTGPRNRCFPHQKHYARGRINHRCTYSIAIL